MRLRNSSTVSRDYSRQTVRRESTLPASVSLGNRAGPVIGRDDFEQSFSDLFTAASKTIDPRKTEERSEFYATVRKSLGTLSDLFEKLPSDQVKTYIGASLRPAHGDQRESVVAR